MISPSFHIEIHSNSLDGITLYEPFDYCILNKLIHSSLLKETFNCKNAAKIYHNEREQLEKYIAKYENGRVAVTYKKSKNNPFGRCDPQRALGLYQIRRQVRHTLAKNRFIDVDIVNCHPIILYQLCLRENFHFPQLKEYIDNRDTHLTRVKQIYGCDRDAAKTAFIMALYGAKFETWVMNAGIDVSRCDPSFIEAVGSGFVINEYSFLCEFRHQARAVQRRIAELNPHIVEITRQIKVEKGVVTEEEATNNKFSNSVTSYVLQEYEVRILEIVFQYCVSRGYIHDNVCVLCADGLMIERRHYRPELLTELADVVKESTGFVLSFTDKAMDEDYLAVLNRNIICNFEHGIKFDDAAIADDFILFYGDKFLVSNDKCYYYNGVYWETLDKKLSILHVLIDTKFMKKMSFHLNDCTTKLAKRLDTLILEKPDDPEISKLKKYLDIAYKGKTSYFEKLRNVTVRKRVVEDICVKLTRNYIQFDSDPLLFAFNNKILDLRTNSFIDPYPELYIATTAGYEYNTHYPTQNIAFITNLIATIFQDEELRNYYLTSLATGMCGLQIENMFIATGVGGNGKSLINSLTMASLGNYAYKLPGYVLMNAFKVGSNPEIANLTGKRFVLIQEADSRGTINASAMKEITGDCEINARHHYSNDTKTKLGMTLVAEFNEMPLMSEVGESIKRRVRAIPFNSRFLPQDIYDALPEDERVDVGVANPEYKTAEFKQQYKQALFEVLRQYWVHFHGAKFNLPRQPAVSEAITRQYLESSDLLLVWFNDTYEKQQKTQEDEADDILYLADVYRDFTFSDTWTNMTKKEKRDLSKSKFEDKLRKISRLRPFFRERDSYINRIMIKKPALVTYRRINAIMDDDVTSIANVSEATSVLY
jgi:phage/plasmid-associated DNA primase